VTKTLPQLPLPVTSGPSAAGSHRHSDVEWTPPSRLYTSESDPLLSSYLSHGYPSDQSLSSLFMPRQQPTHQSLEDFRHQLGRQAERPSGANRHGIYERMFRDFNTPNASPGSFGDGPSTLSRHNSDASWNPYQSTTTVGGASKGFQIPHNGQNTQQANRPDGRSHTPQQPYNTYPTGNGMGTPNHHSQPAQSPKAPDFSPLSQTQSPAYNSWGAPAPSSHRMLHQLQQQQTPSSIAQQFGNNQIPHEQQISNGQIDMQDQMSRHLGGNAESARIDQRVQDEQQYKQGQGREWKFRP